jgi:hypothetical protein
VCVDRLLWMSIYRYRDGSSVYKLFPYILLFVFSPPVVLACVTTFEPQRGCVEASILPALAAAKKQNETAERTQHREISGATTI